jgi:coenzyme PQQ precursor peptide PqqA
MVYRCHSVRLTLRVSFADWSCANQRPLLRVVLGGVILRMKARKTLFWRNVMKIWNKPQVREQAVGMEVTAYLPAGIDLI